MVLGMIGMISLGFAGLSLSEDGQAMWGFFCSLGGFALTFLAFMGFQKRSEFEINNPVTFKLTTHTYAGHAIVLWFLLGAAIVIMTFCKWMGWAD